MLLARRLTLIGFPLFPLNVVGSVGSGGLTLNLETSGTSKDLVAEGSVEKVALVAEGSVEKVPLELDPDDG